MKKEIYKTSIVSLSIATIILLFSSITLGILYSNNIDKKINEDFNMNGYDYFEVNDKDNYFWKNDPILFGADNGVPSGDFAGAYFDYIDPLAGSNTYLRTWDTIYSTPVYKDSKLVGLIGNDISMNKKEKGVCYIDFNGNKKTISPTRGDHEFYILDNQLMYFGRDVNNGDEKNDIIYDSNYNDDEEYVVYDTRDIIGLPEYASHTYQNNEDELHFNAFDIWGDDLIINSRSFFTIFAIHMFEDGEVLPPDKVELDWVLPSDPTSIYFIDEDESGNNPINIIDGETERNSDYTPTLTNSFKNKIISPYYDGKKYDLENYEEAKDYSNNINHKIKFFGEHKISVLNKLLETNNFLDINYNDKLIYLSMHDNHFAGNIDNNFYSLWAEDPTDFADDGNISYTKILVINPTKENLEGIPSMSYKLLLNYDNSTLSLNDMYSPFVSGSLFFSLKSEDGFHNYLTTNSGTKKAIQLIEFESVDTTNMRLVKPELVFEIKWPSDEHQALYRSYPLFKDISNSYWGWNLMELNK